MCWAERKDRRGDEGWRGSCQALEACEKSIRMSPGFEEQKFVSVLQKSVQFTAFPGGSRVKSRSEIFLFLKHRLFKKPASLTSWLVWLRDSGGTAGGSGEPPPLASTAHITAEGALAEKRTRELLRIVNQAGWGKMGFMEQLHEDTAPPSANAPSAEMLQ